LFGLELGFEFDLRSLSRRNKTSQTWGRRLSLGTHDAKGQR